MIRNAVLHQHGQLPLLVDMQALPQPSDVSIICTNVRTVDNKRPSFIDDGKNWFLIPLAAVSFIEVPRASVVEMEAGLAGNGLVTIAAEPAQEEAPPAIDEPALALEADEDLLARIREL